MIAETERELSGKVLAESPKMGSEVVKEWKKQAQESFIVAWFFTLRSFR